MKIGIHQPNFLPWMGYFYKMSQCDVFVLLDHVEYTKKSFTKRVKIHQPNNLLEEQYITIPLQKHSDHASIDSLQLVASEDWQRKIRVQIHQSYCKAPFYNQIVTILDRFFDQPRNSTSFSEFTIEIIQYISELLGLDTKLITSSALDISYSGSDVNLDIVSFLGGHTYVSGMGAKKYQDESFFAEMNIGLEYSDFPSLFERLALPDHFLNKSVLSYLAWYEVGEIREMFTFYRL